MPAYKFKLAYIGFFAAMALATFGLTYLTGSSDLIYSALAGCIFAYWVTGFWPNMLVQNHRELDIRIACKREALRALDERLAALRHDEDLAKARRQS